MKKTLTALAAVAALALSGCGEQKELVRFGHVGSSQDVWLVGGRLTASRVALIFGYMDDFEACTEIAEAYMKAFPATTYGCEYSK
jgi:hypothetical protein